MSGGLHETYILSFHRVHEGHTIPALTPNVEVALKLQG